MNQKTIAKLLSLALTVGLCQTTLPAQAAPQQKAVPKLSAKKLTLKEGKTATLKVKKTSRKAKWTIVSGKKNICLTAKKKRSVKVKGIKAGKAKISCKLGREKLICKVTVKKAGKPVTTAAPAVSATPIEQPTQSPEVTADVTPTAAATVTPSSEPTSTPPSIFSDEIKSINTPGPVADYDCLKVEVGEYKQYSVPIAPGILVRPVMKFFGTEIWRNDIEQIIISDTNQVPEEAAGKFDVSEKQNGSVMAWYTDKDADGKYEMTIGQNGGVVANANSSYLFSDIVNEEEDAPFLLGIENLDTSHVEDMRYMFYCSKDQRKEFDLGDNFDTSNIRDITGMFQQMGYWIVEKIRLGAKFDISKIEEQDSVFKNAGDEDCLYCYVKDDATRDWFVSHAEEMRWHIGVSAGWQYKPESDAYFVSES